MTSSMLPTNYKMKMEYRDMKIEVSGDKKFVEEKFYQLVTAVNKLARHARQSDASYKGESVETDEIMPRPVEDEMTMLDAGVNEDDEGPQDRGTGSVFLLPHDDGNAMLCFMEERMPRSQVDTVLTMALYLNENMKLSDITVRDIHDFYKQTHTGVPKNLSVSLQQNVNKGYLERSGNRKEGVRYNVTKEGSEYVHNGFQSSD